ncbi:MAG: hypothetical protein EZS28_035200, partial [Streblomastix strix]
MKPLPNYALRTLFKQILEGIRIFHSAGLVHRDIKCDNILLHCPPGSGRVYAKLSDFGFAKKEDLEGGNTYSVGTYPFMAPELFQIPVISTQKVDIYAVGITFYRLLTNDYPIKGNIPDDYYRKMTQQMYIKRPPGITDDLLWNLISQMLDFNPDRRITATEALQHEYFTSSEAISDISPEQQELAIKATELKEKGDKTISEYDINPTFIMPETVVSNYFPKDELEELIQNNKENNTPYEKQIAQSVESRRRAFEPGGIIDKMLQILNKLTSEQILPIYFQPFIEIIRLGTQQQRNSLYQKGLLSWAKQFLYSQDEEILLQGALIYKRFLFFTGRFDSDNKQNPLREEMEKDGTLDKLIEMYQNQTINDYKIRLFICSGIGYAYKAICIRDSIGQQLISTLKQMMVDHDQYVSSAALQALGQLAENR